MTKMGMQRMRREGVEGAPGLVPWRRKGGRERVCLPVIIKRNEM